MSEPWTNLKNVLAWQAFVSIEAEACVLNHHSTTNLHATQISGHEVSTCSSSYANEELRFFWTCSAANRHFSFAMSSGSPCSKASLAKEA